ncbi:MAG: glucosaminidase domain-containing protein [Actinobacteria bacterium]|nr:glucosaminidase domain-containing protein [Actinomycetota bacterium]
MSPTRCLRRRSPVRGTSAGTFRRTVAAFAAVTILIASVAANDAGAADPSTTSAPTVTSDPGAPSTTVGAGGTTTSTIAGPPVTSGPGGFGAPVTDPNAPPEPPLPDPSPEVRILLGQLLNQQHVRMVVQESDVQRAGDDAVRRQADLEHAAAVALDRSHDEFDRIQAHLRSVDRDLRADAIATYMDRGSTGVPRLITVRDATGRTRAVLVAVNLGLHLDERAATLKQRDAQKRVIRQRERSLERARRSTERARARARHAAELAKAGTDQVALQQKMLQAPSPGAPVAAGSGQDGWSLPIAGASVFTGPELARWFEQQGHPSHATAPIAELAQDYIDEGHDQGIRGDMAFAQSILETGSFSNPDTIRLNNFAGIGHCDTCASGFAFATAQLGVRGQIQLLADYTQRNVKLAHPLVDPRLHGPSGCCQTWWQLTHTWATAGNYGPRIMGIYREMLWWLVNQRGMTPLVGPS